MPNTGVRNPGRSVLIALAVTLIAWGAVAFGFWEMSATGVETTRSALMIGIGLLPAILGPFFILNFWAGVSVIARIRRGEGVFARWRIPSADFKAFAAESDKRNALGLEHINDWTPPRDVPPEGIEIAFAGNGVLIHDTYFILPNFGPICFERVGILPGDPLAIEFAMVAPRVDRFSYRQTRSVLRLPIPRTNDPMVLKVLEHYGQVLGGKVASNPDFCPNRVRFGLAAASVLLPVAALGFALKQDGFDQVDLPVIMTIFGGIFGMGALVLAIAAWILGRRRSSKAGQ
jgi:hypothetical protein